MLFLAETMYDNLEVLTENTSRGRNIYIEGPFIMTNRINRNQRDYPKAVMEGSVDQYIREYVNERRAVGEFNHPDYPFVNPKATAIMIESMHWQGDNVIGKAKVLNTPDGLIIKELLDNKYKLGVSTRGLGEWKDKSTHKEITKFLLNAVDAVDMPSGQVCYVNSLSESEQWSEVNGVWLKEQAIKQPQVNQERLMEGLNHLFKQLGSSVIAK